MRQLINPWEYRHLHGFGILRIAAGLVASAAAIVCLAYGAYGWATIFLVVGALNLAVGCCFVAIDRGSAARRPDGRPGKGGPVSR